MDDLPERRNRRSQHEVEAVLRRREVPSLYALADVDVLGRDRVVDAVQIMAHCGIGWIQLRAKHLADRDLYTLLERGLRAVEGTSARLWINDRADLAMLFSVAGLHVGQRDLPPRVARELLDHHAWIGQSTHDLDQLRRADADPAVDVIALGPIYPTTGKRDADPAVGLEVLCRARQLTSKPLVAIGGINAERLREVLRAGADSAAVLGAICRGEIEKNCQLLMAQIPPQR